jgi:hypothetical protein
MDKHNPPTSFGVFKPVGQTVIAFRSEDDMEHALASLRRSSYPEASLTQYTAQEMRIQSDEVIRNASPLAAFGYELTISKAHRALAEVGCSFLVVDAPKPDQAEHVALVARACNAVAAQHYGHWLIEEVADLSLAHELSA